MRRMSSFAFRESRSCIFLLLFFVYVSVLCFVSIGCDSPLFSAALLVAMQPVVF